MVMEAAPAASFKVIEAELVLELLVITLDAPAQVRQTDEVGERHRGRQGGEVVLGRGWFVWRPLAQEPFDRTQFGPGPGRGGPDPEGHEARAHTAPRAFAPDHGGPGRGR